MLAAGDDDAGADGAADVGDAAADVGDVFVLLLASKV